MTGNEARNAATVILLRDQTEEQYELFLMRRHRNHTFMGGAFVFPGGRLDPADESPELETYIDGFHAADAKRLLQEPALSDATARGLFMAAIRETFEEAGVLLARDSHGNAVRLTDPDTTARFSAYREEIHGRRLTLTDLARQEGLLYAPDLLLPYSHWITPEIEPKRFNTRFFVTKLPEGQIPVHDRLEMTESHWMTPARALAEHKAGRIVLMPPTLKTMEELLSFSKTGQIFSAARSQHIWTTLPQAFRRGNGYGFRLPYDPEYTLTPYKQPERPGEMTRIIMEDGIWKTSTA